MDYEIAEQEIIPLELGRNINKQESLYEALCRLKNEIREKESKSLKIESITQDPFDEKKFVIIGTKHS